MSTPPAPPNAAEPQRRPAANPVLEHARQIRREIAVFRGDFWLAMAATAAAAGFGLMMPWRMQVIVQEVWPDRDLGAMALQLALLVAIAGTSLAFSTVRRYMMERLCLRMIERKRQILYAHVLAIAPRRIQSAENGQVLSAFSYDLHLEMDSLKTLLSVTIPTAVFALAYTGGMVWFSWQLSLFLLLVILPLILATNFFARRIHAASIAAQNRLGQLMGDLQESLAGTREIKLFAMQSRMQAHFGASNRRATEALLRRERLSALHPLAVSLVVALGAYAIILFSLHMTNTGWVTGAQLTGFVVCLGLAYPPLQEFSHSLGQLAHLTAARERLAQVLAIPAEDERPPATRRVPRDSGLSLRGVRFGYEPGGFALEGIDLEVAPGERVAIVGPSGAGKSTLLELVPRFLEPEAGEIRLGDVRLQDMALPDLRRRIGLVAQVPFVFRATLLENLRAGVPDTPRERVIAVARAARVDEFARRLPQGYDTMIEPGGTNLSVGQRQRIAIARVLLKDPDVLLLDEPTSALDATSERLVGEAIMDAARSRTTLIVAHRLSTVRDVDRVVVLDGGRIVEQGTHAALLARGGLYAELHAQSARADAPPGGDA